MVKRGVHPVVVPLALSILLIGAGVLLIIVSVVRCPPLVLPCKVISVVGTRIEASIAFGTLALNLTMATNDTLILGDIPCATGVGNATNVEDACMAGPYAPGAQAYCYAGMTPERATIAVFDKPQGLPTHLNTLGGLTVAILCLATLCFITAVALPVYVCARQVARGRSDGTMPLYTLTSDDRT